MTQSDSYNLALPQEFTTGVVFSSPHSGREYRAAFLRDSVLDDLVIRSSEDAYVDLLFSGVVQFGAPLLAAKAPRAFVDLNRSALELDPSVIEGVVAPSGNPRVASGLGVIPRVVAAGRSIRDGKISKSAAQVRLERFYHPYHAMLRDLIDTSHSAFGQVLLVDCHSMPSEAVQSSSGMFGRMPEVVIGDRFGASCDRGLVDEVEAALHDAGLLVGRNTPFAGAFITQEYGRPKRGRHVIQLEFDRSLYMDERTLQMHSGFDELREKLVDVTRKICDLGRWPMQVAAE